MKKGWQRKKIGDLCKVIAGQSPDGKFYNSDGNGVPFYQGKKDFRERYIRDPNTWTTQITKTAQKGDILLSVRAPVGPVNFATDEICIGRGLAAIRSKPELNQNFLFYQLLYLQPEISGKEGAVFASISKSEIENLPIALTTLPEQQRIVTILDEAFESITESKVNAEKNLQNARDLFESFLYAVEAAKVSLGDLVNITTGKLDANAAVEFGKYPFFTCSRDIYSINDYAFNCEAVLLAGNNAVGDFNVKHYKGKFNAYQRTYVITVNEKKRILYRFLYFQILKSLKQFKAQSVGAGTKFLKLGMIKDMEIALPSLPEQERIVVKIDTMYKETLHLASFYQRKLAALDELKKSLLHQAFSGELTSRSNIISFPTQIPAISTTDLHAGILAIAYLMHENKGLHARFGHVKAEKIAHIVEAHAGIDLGRTPVKDAAGPNDYPHLIKVESRARKAGYFDFKRFGDGYRVTKLRGFNRLIARTRKKLGDRSRDVEHLIELMLHLNTQQAEIFCTVYAAWNNLLLDGREPTDEEIVREARENWHPEKLKIPRGRFFKAIIWMREKGITPTGKGKKVPQKVRT